MASQGRVINWIIKCSKLCNLRCGYCYEWNELSDRRRMEKALVRRVLQAASELHAHRLKTTPDVRTILIIHGGEPLLLPVEYLRFLLDSAHEIFSGLSYEIAVQSNLFKISEAQIELLKEHGVNVGVSYDVASGVRLTMSGLDLGERVKNNISLVRNKGIRLGAIVVLAKHTAPVINDIYDYFADQAMTLRVLTLADGPLERPLDKFSISLEDTISAMCTLFDHWFETGFLIPVDPLKNYMKDAIRHLIGVTVPKYERRKAGDYAFFVNVDGLLYAERDAYDAHRALGDLTKQNIKEIIRGVPYDASLSREEALLATHCSKCFLTASCAGWPIVGTKSRSHLGGECVIAPSVIKHVSERLLSLGFGRDQFRSMLLEDEQITCMT